MEISASQPRFHHPEIENLYQYGFELPPAIIDSILQLPRDSVIEDLETVLNDTMIRFEDFQMLDWSRQTHSISFHAMMLLGALRSERSLPLLLKVHQQPADWIDFWFSDWFWDSMWEPLVWCGMNQIEVLAAFVKKNEVGDEYAMTNVVEAIAQIGFYFPEKRAEVVHFLEDLFHFFMKRDASGDSEKQRTQVEISVTALAGAVYNLREDSLLPLLEECYEREMVDWGMYGFWGDFMKMYEEENRREYKIFPNVTDWYAHEWKAEQKREAQAQKWLEEQKLQEKRVKKTPLIQYLPTNDRPVSRPAKIGRNEPCPCGSGKKYKRCCGTGEE